MVNIGILSLPATGHLNTILPLGQELQKRGHQVTLFGIHDTQAKTRAAGLGWQGVGKATFPLGWVKQSYGELGKLTGKEAKLYSQNQRQELTAILLEEVPELLQYHQIEALIVDHGEKGGATIAQHLNLPFVTICTALISEHHGRITTEEPILELLNQYRRQWNLNHHKNINDCLSSLSQISQQPAQFDLHRTRRTKLPDYFHFTGPFHTGNSRPHVDFPWEKLTGQPLIYASMGTLQNRLQWVFKIIAQACENLDVQLVISLGGGMESMEKLPGNPLVVSYAPQLKLLNKAILTITHGGLNTTLESLSRGVPLIAIPIAHDQPNVANRLHWKGVGIPISLPDLTEENMHTAIETVLTTESYYQKAAILQTAIRNSPGVQGAGDIVEQAFCEILQSV